MALELVPLCTATVSLAESIDVSPSLVIIEVLAIDVDGERLRASMVGNASADWLQISPEGVGTLDVRATIETHDGALIHTTYAGRLHFESLTAYAAPLFHTGDDRYRWLNAVQAVAKGAFSADRTLVYEMYELR